MPGSQVKIAVKKKKWKVVGMGNNVQSNIVFRYFLCTPLHSKAVDLLQAVCSVEKAMIHCKVSLNYSKKYSVKQKARLLKVCSNVR